MATGSGENGAVKKAIEFIRGAVDKRLSVDDIAGHVHYSPVHLQRMFRRTTGKTIQQAIHEAAINNAKTFLAQTDMNITEVAGALGFDDPAVFSRFFRNMTGTTPRSYRALHLSGATRGTDSSAETVLLRDDFSAGNPGPWWILDQGAWKQADGLLTGTGQGGVGLRLSTKLPENFTLSFGVRITALPPQPDPELHIILQSPAGVPLYKMSLMSPGRESGIFRVVYRPAMRSAAAVINAAAWHSITLELSDNRTTLQIDGKSVFTHSDIFQPDLDSRCQLSIWSSSIEVSLRRFILNDLGVSDIVPSVRRGDTLFNSGLFVKAMEFYSRQLHSAEKQQKDELRYKIGMCYFKNSQFAEAKHWIRTAQPQMSDPHWIAECRLLSMQISKETGNYHAMLKLAPSDISTQAMRDGIRSILVSAYAVAERQGYFARMLDIAPAMLKMEASDAHILAETKAKFVHLFKNMGRYVQTKRLATQLASSSLAHLKIEGLICHADLAVLTGRQSIAAATVNRLASMAKTERELALSECMMAMIRRSERRFDEAMSILQSVPELHPHASPEINLSQTLRIRLLASLDRPDEAAALLNSLGNADAGLEEFTPLLYQLPVYIAQGEFNRAAEVLSARSTSGGRLVFVRGKELLIAGVMMELAGRREHARELWAQCETRFPAHKCYLIARLAAALSQETADELESTVLPYHIKAMLSFLTGLLMRKRRNETRAEALFRLALASDPFLDWPSVMAERMLPESTSQGKPPADC